MKYILGLTGQTGSGKTTLHSVAQGYDFYVIDCDKVAHKVLNENEQLKEKLCSVFSTDILSDGSISRPKLAKAAFKDEKSTNALNETVLPFVKREIKEITNNVKNEYILLDAPTLYESGVNRECSFVVALLADEEIRKKRIIERDNLSEEAALLRLSAAKSDEFYINRADKVIYNNGDLEEYKAEFKKVLKSITEGKL